MTVGTQFEQEILEQPESLRRQLDQGRDAVEAVARRIRAFGPRFVVLAARGSSDNAARYAQYVFGARNGWSTALATPSLFTTYRSPPSLEGALVVGISQSGQSPDIVAVLSEARRQSALTLAITNDASSALAAAAEYVIPLFSGEERAVAASKTYTSQLMAVAMLSSAVLDREEAWSGLEEVPARVGEVVVLGSAVAAYASRCRYAERYVVIGRGFNYATAFEVALKIKETSYVIAEAYSSADFRHGPMAMLDRGFPVIVVAPSSAVSDDLHELMGLLSTCDAEVIAISDDPRILARAQSPLPLPTALPEWLSPIVTVVPGQLFALGLARQRGVDPDRPRGLAKVTRTR